MAKNHEESLRKKEIRRPGFPIFALDRREEGEHRNERPAEMAEGKRNECYRQ